MQITASAVSLNVADVPASAAFLTSHFGFRQDMAADGFASLAREDAGMHVAFLRRGLPLLPEDQRDTHAAGLILAFVVEDLEGELAACAGRAWRSPCRCARSPGASARSRSPTPMASSSNSSTGTRRPASD